MELNYVAIVIASVLQFICGAIWYSALFGKLWGQIHGFDKLSKEVQAAMMKSMGPMYAVQFIVTLVATTALSLLMASVGDSFSAYSLAALVWLGFVVPTQISAVIFGGTENKWMVKKIAVQAGASLVCIEVAAAVLSFL